MTSLENKTQENNAKVLVTIFLHFIQTIVLCNDMSCILYIEPIDTLLKGFRFTIAFVLVMLQEWILT